MKKYLIALCLSFSLMIMPLETNWRWLGPFINLLQLIHDISTDDGGGSGGEDSGIDCFIQVIEKEGAEAYKCGNPCFWDAGLGQTMSKCPKQ